MGGGSHHVQQAVTSDAGAAVTQGGDGGRGRSMAFSGSGTITKSFSVP